jgi:putative membrane protein
MSLFVTVGALVADRYGMMGDGDGNGWMWVWGGMMILLLVVVIGAVVWAVARTAPRATPQPHDRARAILAERFARGDITSEEYQERAQHLT